MKVADFNIKDEYLRCGVNEKIIDVLKKIKANKSEKKITYIIVVDKEKPVGIISFRDIVLKFMNKKDPIGQINVENIMTSPIVTVKEETDAEKAYSLMTGMGFRSLPVVDSKENLMGCITIPDIVKKIYLKKEPSSE